MKRRTRKQRGVCTAGCVSVYSEEDKKRAGVLFTVPCFLQLLSVKFAVRSERPENAVIFSFRVCVIPSHTHVDPWGGGVPYLNHIPKAKVLPKANLE